jgi:hypothetical protein
LKCGGGVYLRGGLVYDTTAMSKYSDFDSSVDIKVRHADVLNHSVDIDSINSYVSLYEATETTSGGSFIFTVLPNKKYDKKNNSGEIETFYDMIRIGTGAFGNY